MIRRFRAMNSELRSDEQGSVAILVGLAIFVLVLGAGAAVDMARAQILHTKIQESLDAAGLAALAALPSTPQGIQPADWATQQANRYFHANFPNGYLQTNPITVAATLPNGDQNTVTVTATSTQTTTFMSMVGIDTVNVGASSTVTRASTGQTTELVLVLDNTGSMNCDVSDPSPNCTNVAATAKILALKTAAQRMMEIIYNGTETSAGLFIGVVPFSQTVNIGTNHVNWLAANGNDGPTNVANAPSLVGQTSWGNNNSWAGCIQERVGMGYNNPNSVTYTDDAPYNYSPNNFKPYFNPSEPTNVDTPSVPLPAVGYTGSQLHAKYQYYYNRNPTPVAYSTANVSAQIWEIPGWQNTDTLNFTVGPNASCPETMLPMVAEKTAVLNEINNLYAGGNTLISEGLIWGWRMLSPNWLNQWGGEMDSNSLPKGYNLADDRKIVVLMTDGNNQLLPYYYTAFGWLWNYDSTQTETGISPAEKAVMNNAVTAELDTGTDAVCNAMKAKGIEIYTIGFGTAATVNTTLLSNCASVPTSSHYFLAPTDAQLETAFQQIAQALVTLRVVK